MMLPKNERPYADNNTSSDTKDKDTWYEMLETIFLDDYST